jgi:hypothetical protein
MSSVTWRIILTLAAFAAAVGFGCGIGLVARQTQALAATYGEGFTLIVGLMTLLLLISVARMPLSHASVRRRRR